jgi:hypothetical protein
MKRALAIFAPLAIVVGLAACGDDDDSPDSTTATEETATEETATEATVTDATTSDDTTEAGGSTGDTDLMARVFPDLDEEELDCVVEKVGDLDPSQVVTQAEEIADECGIDRADLTPDMSAISIPDLSDVSMPENMDELIQQVFPNLSDEQADCLVEQLGDDFDVAKARAVAETCDIDPSDMLPG